MATAKRKPKAPDWNYETTVGAIESTLNLIESGDMDLADVFEQFSSAIDQLKQCEKFLGERQSQVDLLIETLTDEDF